VATLHLGVPELAEDEHAARCEEGLPEKLGGLPDCLVDQPDHRDRTDRDATPDQDGHLALCPAQRDWPGRFPNPHTRASEASPASAF
jgi:hypothetical protein